MKRTLLATLLLLAGAADAALWEAHPFVWQEDAATKTFRVSHLGSGFAVNEAEPRGARVRVVARVTPERTTAKSWATLGVSLYDDARNFWHAALVQAPQSHQNGAHFFELSEMRGGLWLAQDSDRLTCTKRRQTADWTYGETYELALESAPEGISATVKNARGDVIWECAYAFPKTDGAAVTCGRPALHVTGGLRGSVAVQEAASAEPRPAPPKAAAVIPPYASDSFVPGVTDKATGFFRVVQKEDGRWWTIDPLGRGMALFGVDHITYWGHWSERTKEHAHLKVNKVLFPNKADWETNTLARLKAWGFNLLGAGSDPALQHRGLVHTVFLSIGDSLCWENMESEFYICPNEHRPCSAFPNVFHPQFAAWADYLAKKKCAPNKADPWLFGYFIDNELAWWGRGGLATGLFDAVAQLPEAHSARQAQKAFLAERGVTGAVSDDVKIDFLRQVADIYFRVTSEAIRRHDPNHLVLGARFAGLGGAHPAVWETAGRYCDVVTFNCYPWADLDRNEVRLERNSRSPRVVDAFTERYALVKRPMLITEWSFPALDSGLPCTGGAGQRFRTQTLRTQATELFARTMLALPCLLGYDYFMWVDEPAAGISDAFPEDSNYGLINEKSVAYPEITAMFTRLQRDVRAVRAAGVPAVRAAAPAAGETAAAFAARAGLTGGATCTRAGDRYVIRNAAGLELEGRVGGGMMFDRVAVKGKPLGTYTGMSYTDIGWRDAGRVVAADWREEAGHGVLRVTCEARLSADCALRQTHDIAVWRDRPWFLCTFVSAQNVGRKPIEVKAFYFREYSPFAFDRAKATARKGVPNLWKAPMRDAWVRASDGAYYGGLTFAPTVQMFYYELMNDNKSQHPDAMFAPHTASASGTLLLAPHATYDAQGTIWMLAVCGLDGEAAWTALATALEQ